MTMTRDPIVRPDILRVYEYLGGQLPGHIKTSGWTPIRCIVHDGFSGSINPSLQKFYCFGCDARGDGYDLLLLVEGIALNEARELAEQQGWLAASGGRAVKGPPRKSRHPARPDRTARGRKPERG